VAIESGDSEHAYGVLVPDLPGCFSAGDTLDEALTNGQEAILLHIEGLLDDGKPKSPEGTGRGSWRRTQRYA
jgi:predicted RNase H-like HicB family nuclease